MIAAPLALTTLPRIAAADPGTTTTVTTMTTNHDDTTSVVTTTTTVQPTVQPTVRPTLEPASCPASDPAPPPPDDAKPAPKKDKAPTFGVWFGDTVQLGHMGHRIATWNEMEMGVQFLPRVSISGGLNIMMGPNFNTTNAAGASRKFSAVYGGMRAAYAVVHREHLDIGVDGYVGGGRACLAIEDDDHDALNCVERQPMLVTEPRIFANYRFANMMRLGVAGGYRFVTRKPLKPDDRFRLSGPFVALTLDFGAWG